MGLVDDPISGVLGAFFQKAFEAKIWKRAELLLEMAVSGGISFLVSAGATLLAKQPVPFALGTGMVMAGVMILATFSASPNSKGLTIVVTAKAAEEKLDTPSTTIEHK